MNGGTDPMGLARNIVNQLFDEADVPVERRQEINDRCDEFVATAIKPTWIECDGDSPATCPPLGTLVLCRMSPYGSPGRPKYGLRSWTEAWDYQLDEPCVIATDETGTIDKRLSRSQAFEWMAIPA